MAVGLNLYRQVSGAIAAGSAWSFRGCTDSHRSPPIHIESMASAVNDKPRLLIVGGPDGSGKTTVAMQYATAEEIPNLGADETPLDCAVQWRQSKYKTCPRVHNNR